MVRKVIRLEPTMTVREASLIFRTGEETIRRNVKSGKLTGGKVGRAFLISGYSVADALNAAGIPARVRDSE